MALRFQNVKDDEESAELAKKLKSMNASEATKDITGKYTPPSDVVALHHRLNTNRA